MAVFEPTVPRWIYEQKCQEYNDLLEKYHALRPLQSIVNPMKVVPPKLDSATQAIEAGEQAMRDPRLAAAVVRLMEQKPGLSEGDALREAKKLLEVATGRADAPTPVTIGPALR